MFVDGLIRRLSKTRNWIDDVTDDVTIVNTEN